MTTANEQINSAYELARALLIDRDHEDIRAVSFETQRCLLRMQETKRAQPWAGLPDEAEYHGVAPLLEPMVEALAQVIAVPYDVRRSFVALASRHRRAALARETSIDQLITAFEVAGIPVILLKGAALAHRLYRNPALRPMVDIDVLIDHPDAERATRVAKDLGYSFASRHESRFAGRMHHLPVATTTRSGFRIVLEIHLNAMSPNQADSLAFATLSEEPQAFSRGLGPAGLALGHTDMLRHLAHHAFEPARRLRLIHLYDLWRYEATFRNETDWVTLGARFPEVIVILRLVSYVFAISQGADELTDVRREPVPAGVGLGMVPLSEIASTEPGFVAKLAALFNPPPWWLHGFYGVPPEKSLLVCRTVRHPARVMRWLARRLVAGIGAAATRAGQQ